MLLSCITFRKREVIQKEENCSRGDKLALILPTRARYYQAMMDIDFLRPGKEYTELAECDKIKDKELKASDYPQRRCSSCNSR